MSSFLSKFFKFGSQNMAIDLGTANTLVYVQDRGIVLDEPSASLDPERERAVVEAYRAWMRGGTTLVISHRLEVVRAADRVVVIDGARVIDTGTPDELAARDGRFRELFATGARMPS